MARKKRTKYVRDRLGQFAEVAGSGSKKRTKAKSKTETLKKAVREGKLSVRSVEKATREGRISVRARDEILKSSKGGKKLKVSKTQIIGGKSIGPYSPVQPGKTRIREEAVKVEISTIPKPIRLRIDKVVEPGVQQAIDDGRDTHALFDKLPTPKDRPDLAWNEERQEQHKALLDDVYAEQSEGVPSNKRIVMSGGLPGAGKTHTLEKNLGIAEKDFVVINPDAMKEELFKRGMIPDDYESEYGLSPGEAATLIHEESSFLAKQLFDRALADKKNIIFDTTMNSNGSVEKTLGKLERADYGKPEVVFIEVDVEVSKERAQGRYVRAALKWEKDHKGFGGRYVPPSVSGDQTDPKWGSKNRAAFEAYKEQFPDYIVIDHNEFGNPKVVEQPPGSKFRFGG